MKKTCKQCGKEFELTQSEINFYKSKNLSLPKRCKECREQNKADKGGKHSGSGKPTNGSYTGTTGNYNYYGTGKKGGKGKKAGITGGIAVLVLASVLGISGNLHNEQQSGQQIDNYVNQPVIENVIEDSSYEQNDASIQAVAEETVEEVVAVGEETAEEIADTEETAEEENENLTEETSQPIETVPQTREYRFRSNKLLNEHYNKHGIEMGFASAEDYEKAAEAVVNDPNALHKIEAEDGDDVYYIEASNEFVIVSKDGYIRTYFKPSSGIKYYNRQ